MRLFLSAIAIAVATAALLVGCNTGNGVVTVASTQSNVRIVNLIPNAGAPLVVTLDDDFFASGVAFQSLSLYQSIKAGVHTFRAFVTGAPSNVIATDVATLGEANYSYVMYGPITAPVARIYDDTFSDPGAGNFNVRVINAAAGIGLIDVYLTAPGADLNRVSPSVSSVEYAAVVSPFSTLPVGNLQLRVTPAGSKQVIYDSAPFNYQERGGYDIVVYTRGSANLVNVAVLAIDGEGSGTIIDNLLAQFKVINASTVASPLNVFFDGALKLSNIPIAGATGYQRTTVGPHTLTVEATATPGATLLTFSPVLMSAMDVSIILEGPAGALQAVLLPDNNLPPGPGNARVRVVNATADVSAIDVFVNFSKQISALPQNSGASSLELTADGVTGTSFQFSFNVAGSSQTLLTLPAVTLIGTKTYTLYVVGPATGVTAGLTQDN